MSPSLTWKNGSETFDVTYYCGVNNSGVNNSCSDQKPETHGCYVFELENAKLQTGLFYNITSKLTINSSCSSEYINNNMTMKCSATEDVVEEVLICLPGKNIYKNTSPYNNYREFPHT